jgi:hypothetical protein
VRLIKAEVVLILRRVKQKEVQARELRLNNETHFYQLTTRRVLRVHAYRFSIPPQNNTMAVIKETGESSMSAAKKSLKPTTNGPANYELPWYQPYSQRFAKS